MMCQYEAIHDDSCTIGLSVWATVVGYMHWQYRDDEQARHQFPSSCGDFEGPRTSNRLQVKVRRIQTGLSDADEILVSTS